MADIIILNNGASSADFSKGIAADAVVVLSIALTPSAPASASVSNASVQIVAANNNRKSLILTNTGEATVYVAYAPYPAVVGMGLPIFPGGVFPLSSLVFSKVAINGISDGVDCNIAIQEYE